MNILFVICSLSIRHGGPTQACLDTAECLQKRGHSVEIYTTEDLQNDDLPFISKLQNKGISIHIFPITLRYFFLTRYHYFSLPLARFLSKNISKFDLVYIYSLYRFPPTISCFYSRKYKIPYIMNPHGSLDPYLYKKNRVIKSLYEKAIEFKNLNHAAAIHYTSREERDLVSPLNIKARNFIIPHGINLAHYVNHPCPYQLFPELREKKVLLFLGRINFKKGLDLLIPAFAKMVKEIPTLVLVLAGPDNEEYGTKVKEWIKEYGLEEKTIFTGMLLEEKKRAILSLADLFVLPSYTENFGIAVAEAMAMEKAVVISDKVNIWQEVKDAGAGLVVSCNVDEIAEACIKILQDPNLAKEMGKRGRKLVENRYSIEATTQVLEEEFIKTLDSHINNNPR
ncbi:glycosyltransferase [Methylacidiphilum caldifontis]|uniref:Glycosyl transferase n=1 Tax=Methylacidiphilum caldifontis TaxID=2795386 RepID=A0A4Y8P7X7_9BACT|nr:glycosyltransferase [Methylacidiphilum caldifontis]TFE66586.1 glycosyl transferase [Methylacidiphilum caldifontis]